MTTSQINIAEKLMTIRLNCSFSFGSTTDRQITAETNATKGTHALRVRKDLFPGASGTDLRNLHGVLQKFYMYHKGVTMESITEGERLLPVAFLLDYEQEFANSKLLVDQSYATFEANYSGNIAAARPLLGAAFNLSDYPPVTELAHYLRFRMLRLPLPNAGVLLNKVGESVQEDVNTFMQEAVKAAFADVHGRAKELLENMVKVLHNPSGRVHDTLLGKLVELVAYIPEFNVTQDDSLTLLAEEIKTRLLIYNTASLQDKSLRSTVADQAMEILRKMQ